jgi:uncharacterized protein YndB with AHSA1/START domain
MSNKITASAIINADIKKVWEYYTNPNHIIKWNFADPSWQCPSASNDMRVGGKYSARMEAKDGSFGFEFEAVYSEIEDGKSFTYGIPDGRQITVVFDPDNDQTEVTITFDAENQNPIEMQKNGWQAILNNFKSYTETN